MKGLPRKIIFMEDNHQINVWDVTTKSIVFIGNIDDAANFLGITSWYARTSWKRKSVIKKKYTLRTQPAQ